MACTGCLGQYYPAPYQYGYQAPYLTPYAPVAYQDYNLMPTQRQAYNEYDRYSSFWLQPIDSSFMPDSPIPGFQGLGAGPLFGELPTWMKVAFGLGALGAAYLIFKKK